MNDIPLPPKKEQGHLEPPTPQKAEEGEPSKEDFIEMRCYIKYNLYYGQKLSDIIQSLLKAGWKREEIEKAYRELRATFSKPQPRSS